MYKEPRAMREIHEIQERLYERWKDKSDKQIIEDIHKGSEECIRRYNLKFKTPIHSS